MIEFTLSYIENGISEPSVSGRVYYVSTSGSDGNDGLSASRSFRTISKAASIASAGDIVYIRAGNYGSEQVEIRNSGTPGNPIKFIGYKNSPNDISSMYYQYAKGRGMNSSEMPYLRSSHGDAKNRGIYINGKNNIIVKNIQIEGYGRCVYATGSVSNVVIENVLTNGALSNYGNGVGIGIYATPAENKIRVKDCVSINHGMINFFLIGNNSMIDNCHSYADATSDAMDYHISIRGSENIVRRSTGLRSENTSHGSHGIGIKSEGIRSEYNLIEDVTMRFSQDHLICFDIT